MTNRKLCKYGNACYQTNHTHRLKFIHPGDKDFNKPLCKFWLKGFCRDGDQCLYSHFCCPCGGGQSCLVDRRKNKDWVYEDDIAKMCSFLISQDSLRVSGQVISIDGNTERMD